jgi:hypothetical protein
MTPRAIRVCFSPSSQYRPLFFPLSIFSFFASFISKLLSLPMSAGFCDWLPKKTRDQILHDSKQRGDCQQTIGVWRGVSKGVKDDRKLPALWVGYP